MTPKPPTKRAAALGGGAVMFATKRRTVTLLCDGCQVEMNEQDGWNLYIRFDRGRTTPATWLRLCVDCNRRREAIETRLRLQYRRIGEIQRRWREAREVAALSALWERSA